MADNKIIHASGQVRIDKIDHYGIFNNEKSKYTHKLRVIKRVLPTTGKPILYADEVQAIEIRYLFLNKISLV